MDAGVIPTVIQTRSPPWVSAPAAFGPKQHLNPCCSVRCRATTSRRRRGTANRAAGAALAGSLWQGGLTAQRSRLQCGAALRRRMGQTGLNRNFRVVVDLPPCQPGPGFRRKAG